MDVVSVWCTNCSHLFLPLTLFCACFVTIFIAKYLPLFDFTWALVFPQSACYTEISNLTSVYDRLCGLVVRVLGYRSGGPGSILSTTRKKVVGLKRGPLSLVSTTEDLLYRKVAAPV
jgi:hypothetical protein